LRAPVPRQMEPFLLRLGILWTLRFEQMSLRDVVKVHNDAYHDDVDVIRLTPEQLKHIDTGSSEIWLASVAQKPVGFVELSLAQSEDPHKRTGRIDSVAVLPDFRDQ